jgi:hypothetical protein
MRRLLIVVAVFSASAAFADEPEAAAPEAATPAPPPPAKPSPYSLPWHLRPAVAGNVARLDTSIAFLSGAGGPGGWSLASLALLSYRVIPNLAPFVRAGFVSTSPVTGTAGQAVVNPALGASYGFTLGESLRGTVTLGVTVPVGMGGGDTPAPEEVAAVRSGIYTRSAMDNAMFAVNDLTVFPGANLAFVSGGFTAQAEATLLQLTRVRGAAVQADAFRTNLTSGLHLGYFFTPMVNASAEVRYQRWLSTPANVAADETLRDTVTAAMGLRLHFKLAETIVARPGISYTRGFDQPMLRLGYDVFQLDLPVSF